VWNLVSKKQGRVFKPMNHEDVLKGPRNNNSDDIKTYFYAVFMTSLKRHINLMIYDFYIKRTFMSHCWAEEKLSLADSGTPVRKGLRNTALIKLYKPNVFFFRTGC
jgi:hypothetical protein